MWRVPCACRRHFLSCSRLLSVLSDGSECCCLTIPHRAVPAHIRGLLEGTQGGLAEAELEYLPWSAKLMTLECGIRFLTDYLDGDNYFHIHYPKQNLDCCRTQFKLVADMEKQWEQMAGIVKKLVGGVCR